ncbi:MAG: dTDP-4-dehydrorhamnose reductase [Nitrospirae bacterium GWF2_44_13]|nr:MAG: dTDP-4-dehydrorhamnose reductase [Nitrospirae bacterium GWF2_44_13]OGW33308.1 MAG: dTDP-4-dehydrorhamnose reductase [Nitrospirae bacterium GWD2_44_7]OGW64768.1 MAG: dTDP-4-dehydrorhamnose reductase [Nitrospirae bacterium RIFOXYA2_FULL_44_9]HBG92129.1 dTDP-4-dehydrorhamnose reductase [Nitrospiraceae bacterium]
MKILITGSESMLARDLMPVLKENNEIIPLSKQEMDITQKDAVIKNIKRSAPDIVINCAAYTKVDTAEEERGKAFQVNGIGVQNIAIACAEMQIPLCHISTDYVFDGKKSKPYTPFDAPNPLNVYGESKLAGEKYIQWITNKFYIVRTSGLYGRGNNNFVITILRLAKEQSAVKVVTDQICSPTYTLNLSAGIKKLIESGSFGIYHIADDSGSGISWFDYAREIVSMAGIRAEIIPVTSEEFPRPAKRPAYSVLDTEITRLSVNYTPEKREVALKKFLSTAKRF